MRLRPLSILWTSIPTTYFNLEIFMTVPANDAVPESSAFEMKAETVDRSNKLVAAAERAVITDDDSFGKGGDLIKLIRAILLKMEDERTSWVKPLNDQVKRINASFKVMREPLEAQVSRVNALLTTYSRAEIARKQKIIDDAAALALEQAVVAEEAGDTQAAEVLVEVAVSKSNAPAAPTTVRGNYGSSSNMSKGYKCKVTDVNLIPEKYLIVGGPEEFSLKVRTVPIVVLNVVTVAAAVKAGTKKIPGLEITDDSKVVVR